MGYEKQIEAITSTIDRVKHLYVTWSKLRGENYYRASIAYMLYASGAHFQKDMSENYGLPKQTINNVIVSLEKEGYITLTVDKKDKRSKLICLTESGRAYAKEIVEPLMICEERTLARMGAQKVDMLIDLLDEYALFLEKEMTKYQS